MELIEQIREKCIEVNPDIWLGRCPKDTSIRLADVLLAIDRVDSSYSVAAFGGFEKWTHIEGQPYDTFKLEHSPKVRWNLREDDLTKQSPETLTFIVKVLGISS